MSEYPWDDDGDGQNGDPNPRDLRTQISSLGEKLRSRDEEIARLTSRLRTQDIGTILVEKFNLPGRLAGLVPADIEATDEAVKAWVDTYGEFFAKPATEGAENTDSDGGKPEGEGVEGGKPSLSSEEIAGLERAQSLEASAGSTTPDIEAAQIAQLQQAYREANGSSDAFFEILTNAQPTT